VCRSKKKGGLRVKDLRKQSISLLCKWWWKIEKEDGLWQKIVREKYLKNKTVTNVKARASDSPSWRDLLKVQDYYLCGREVVLNKGDIVRFWLDPWEGDVPLAEKYPGLFNICHSQEVTFEQVAS
jgi:hypothetical protein